MKEELYEDLTLDKEEQTDFRALFFKYFIHWPWFVASVVVCLLFAYIYLRYQPPIYEVSSSILIKEDEKKSNTPNALAAIQDFGMFSMTSKFDNEIEILHSRTLIKKVVSQLGLYTSLSQKSTFGYNRPLYQNAPFHVFMTAEEAERLKAPVQLEMKYTPNSKEMEVEVHYVQNEEVQEMSQRVKELPAILPTPVGVITITALDSLNMPKESVTLEAVISTPSNVAKGYFGRLTIEPTSKTSTIAAITLKESIPQRGIDFIYALVSLYNQEANNEKNEVAQKSAEFIEERIRIINGELGNTENELASFKQRSGLTNLSSDAQLALQENSRYQQQLTENATQINLVTDLRNYINNPANANEVIPSNIGLKDVSLTGVIDQYNNLLIERKRLLRTSSENNPAVINLNTGIEATRHNVEATINSVLRGLQITRADLDRQTRKFEGRISDAPKQEKEFMSIARQQEIKATLYTMLLQKREENAITLAATANNGRIIEEPTGSPAPVAPKKKVILLAALALGIAIPVGILYLIELFSFRIEGHDDVERLTKVPIIADVPLAESIHDSHDSLVVRENDNDLMAETFRNLRTNLLFMMGDPDKKVVLVTSTTSGEGKTFIASNLAISLSLLGKRVIILGLDIRKPGLNKVFQISRKEHGITQYLASPKTVNLNELIRPSGVTEKLDLIPGGLVPPNPTELLSSTALEDMIEKLRQMYDYIVMDTAPIGMVTDTQLIGRVADASIYVCRTDFTSKNDYQLINELQERKRLPNLCTVINGIDMAKKKYGYYYGYGKYGKYYGYGKRYGYGYGYGYGKEEGITPPKKSGYTGSKKKSKT